MPARAREPDEAVDLLARARLAMDRGTPREAARLLTRAGEGTDDVALQVQIAITLANAEFELSGFDRATARLAAAAQDIERHGLDRLLISVHNQRGLFLLRVGRLPDAIEEFDAGLALGRAAPPTEVCKVLLNRAVAHMDGHDLVAARADLSRCARRARQEGLGLLELKATHNLGYVEFLANNLPAALELMDRAYEMDPTVAPGIAMLGKAEVLVAAGLTRAAEDTLRAAAEIFGHDRLTQDLGETELERARCALIAGDVEGARRLAMRARDRFRRRRNGRWQGKAQLLVLQGDLAAGRPGSRLVGPALRLEAELAQEGSWLAARTAALIAAEAMLASGALDAAQEVVARQRRPSPNDPITARLHTQYVGARLDAARRRRRSASRRAGRALGELAAYQGTFGSIDLATAAAVHGRRLAELDLALALETGTADAVLTATELSRAVSARLPPVRPPADPTAAALLTELRQTVEAMRFVEQDPAAVAGLDRTRADLERRIASRGWSRSGGGGAARTVPALDDVEHALGTSTLVSLCRSRDRIFAAVLGPGGRRLVALGAADEVDELVRRVRADMDVLAQPRLPGPLHGAVRASMTRSLGLLDAQLLAPLALPGRVVVVATGTLGQLPWGLLPSLRGVPVVVAPSASAWHSAHTRARSRRRRVVAVAGPGVARGGHEAAEVARIWGGRTLERAGSREVTAALAGSRILHVAAHGVHQTENPLFSSIRLADGPLFAHELDQSASTPEHVVLSACELGLATVRPGDEALGLTSVLLHLGTRCVVAGVARVGDEVAAAAMADYHRRLRAGADAALALAGATEAAPGLLPFVCFGATC